MSVKLPVKTAMKPIGGENLPENVFAEVWRRINEAAVGISPSGSNGRMTQFLAVVGAIFTDMKVNQEVYWDMVRVKSGLRPPAESA